MDEDKLENYRDNLSHLVRPEDPRERVDSFWHSFHNYEALYLKDILQDYGAYGTDDAEKTGIAEAYVEYIKMVVHDEQKTTVKVFAHTTEARELLRDAVEYADENGSVVDDLHGEIERKLTERV